MKSAIAAMLLLAILITTCHWVSKEQEKVVSPILEKISYIDTSKETLDEEERQNALYIVKAARKEFKNRTFIIEIGVPQVELQKIESFMNKAVIYLNTREYALFFSQIKELSESLCELKNFGKINFRNIT